MTFIIAETKNSSESTKFVNSEEFGRAFGRSRNPWSADDCRQKILVDGTAFGHVVLAGLAGYNFGLLDFFEMFRWAVRARLAASSGNHVAGGWNPLCDLELDGAFGHGFLASWVAFQAQ